MRRKISFQHAEVGVEMAHLRWLREKGSIHG